MQPIRKTIVVLGAGPAGLSVGYELSRRGIDFVILEKGDLPGESFSHYPRNIFFGPWLNNTLPGSKVPWSWKLRRSTQPAYTWYLGEYARHYRLPIDYQQEVVRVLREGEGFRVETRQAVYSCQLLVNATGYFSTPNLPHYPGQLNSSLVFMHSQSYRSADDLQRRLGRDSGRVLVVGAGLTAGETLLDLHRRGYQVSLSHRGPLVFGPSPWMEALLSPFHWVAERLRLFLKIPTNSNPPMAGGLTQSLIQKGQVQVFPGIERFEDRRVIFVDGQEADFEAVIWATGYHYTTTHLRDLLGTGPIQLLHMESLRAPGLFFLGMDQQRTYRSRFLRGIRADARILGRLLEERLSREPLAGFEDEFEVDLERVPELVEAGRGG